MEKTNTMALPAKNHLVLMCRKSIIENARKLLLAVGIYLGACLVLGLWLGYLDIPLGPIGFMLYSFFAMIICAFIDSKTFAEFTSREGRISIMMTPASAADKYWSRAVAIIVGIYVLLFAGWYVMCCGNVLLLGVKHDLWFTDLLNPFDAIGYFDWRDWFSLMVTSMLVQSLYILGSVAWPKHSFLKSSAVLIGCYLTLVFMAVGMWWYAREFAIYIMSHTVIGDSIFYLWRGTILILSFGLLWWGYKIFERKQII